jgi:hypothetical protein
MGWGQSNAVDDRSRLIVVDAGTGMLGMNGPKPHFKSYENQIYFHSICYSNFYGLL